MHFPDGEVRFGETLTEALRRSLQEDLGVTQIKIEEKGYACFPIEYIQLVCLPDENYDPAREKHILTLHFHVSLPDGAPLAPRPGIEIHWWPFNPCWCLTHQFVLRPSTAEIFRRFNEEDDK